MAFSRSSVGIDIGAHAIKVVHLKITEKGAFIQNVLYFDRAQLAARGVDTADRGAIAALLRDQMSQARIPTRNVVLGIAANDAILRYTTVPPVPAWRLKVMMDYEVAEVAEKVGERLASEYQVLAVPREAEDDQVVLVGLVKEEPLEALLADLESAGIHAARAIPAPLALYTTFGAFGTKADPESPDDDLAVVVDVGRSSLNVVLVLNDRLAYARSVSFGGDAFTQALADELSVDAGRAEDLKLRMGTVDFGAASTANEGVVNSLRGAASQLVNLIQSSLRFARTQVGIRGTEPSRIVIQGGGTRLRGLVGFLQHAFGKPVEIFHPHGVVATGKLEGDAAEVFGSFPGDFSVPIGLAVAGVRESGQTLSILPKRYVERRRFRDRTVYLIAAAVLMGVTLVLGFAGAYKVNAAADAQAAMLASRRQELQGLKAEMESNSAANGAVRERLNRILREVEVTAFQAFLLDFLQTRLPGGIVARRISLVPALDQAQADFDYSVFIEGTSDNANQQGLEAFQDLIKALRAEARVKDVRPQKMEPSGTRYDFEMFITPRFQLY